MLNTAVVTGATLLVSLVSSLLAAYALAYLDVPFSRGIVLALFATYLVPQGVLFVPLVRTLSRLHLTNTLVSLILTYPGLVIPFGTWVLWSLFVSLPPDLVDTARIEGAGVLAVLRRVQDSEELTERYFAAAAGVLSAEDFYNHELLAHPAA